MPLTRREFLTGCLGLTYSLSCPSFLLPSAADAYNHADQSNNRADRVLVVVELQGGNDALNTPVPFSQSAYYQARPNLAVSSENLLPVSADLALHASLAPLYERFKQGQLALFPGVGYEPSAGRGHSRSHVRAAQILHSGQPDIIGDTGWLGRYLDNLSDQSQSKVRALAVSCGDTDITNIAPALCGKNKDRSRCLSLSGGLNQYPQGKLSASLSAIAEQIASGAGHKVYTTTMEGFDTHSGQLVRHPLLLANLATALDGFLCDLKRRRLGQSVIVLVQSEFGRRLTENVGCLYSGLESIKNYHQHSLAPDAVAAFKNNGTDHGSTGLSMVLGESVNGGIFGDYGDLSHLVDDEIVASTDFRTIYATIIDSWLEPVVDSKVILGKQYQTWNIC